MNSKEKDFRTKQEGDVDQNKFPKISSSSRQWSSFKNPRIVRVSRTFGGKDRHSKVCTVRGLRDRRIRLSVPTAIQLYDLQDRLGLSQPSKVVDWLLDATKHDIDKLPPLPIPTGNFSQFQQESANPQSSFPHFSNPNLAYAKEFGIHQPFLSRKVEGIKINNHHVDQRETIVQDQENQEGFGGYVAQLSAQNFFPVANQSSFPSAFLNNVSPYNSHFHWDPSNLSVGGHSFTNQTEESNNSISAASMAFPSSSQLYFYPSATTLPSIIPPLIPSFMSTSMENDLRQVNHLQPIQQTSLMPTLRLISSPVKSNINQQTVRSPEKSPVLPNKESSKS